MFRFLLPLLGGGYYPLAGILARVNSARWGVMFFFFKKSAELPCR